MKSAPASRARRTRSPTAAMVVRVSLTDVVCTQATVNVSAIGRAPGSGIQQLVELALLFEGVKLIATADAFVIDENLRHGMAPTGALPHGAAQRRIAVNVNLFEFHALIFQQLLGPVAEWAPHAGINFNFGHGQASSCF